MRLTKRGVEALVYCGQGNAAHYVWDDDVDGLGVRVYPSGRKTFIFTYLLSGRRRWMTLGRFPVMSVEKAREEAGKHRGKVYAREDPQGRRPTGMNVETLARDFLAHLEGKGKPGESTRRKYRQLLEKDALPEWGRLPIEAVKRHDVLALLERVAARGAPVGANRLFSAIRPMFKWAVRRGLLESSPCTEVEKVGEETRRARVLSAGEIRIFWTGLADARMFPSFKGALKLILITAQRPGEVLGMSRGEVEENVWTIPAERSKNRLAHRVPLTDLALEVLKEGGWKYFFPGRREELPANISSLGHALQDFRLELGLDHFTAHDLRRTAASHMASIGVSETTIPKILNHLDSSVTAVYNRYGYDKEKGVALTMWANKLREIITGTAMGAQVVPFPNYDKGDKFGSD